MSADVAKTVGNFVSLLRGTTYKSSMLGEDGPFLLGLASIQRNGGFRADNLKQYSGESAKKLLLHPGDLFVSLKDVTQSADLLGAVARVPQEIPVGRLTQDTVRLIFDGEEIERNYLYWLLRTPEYRAYCKSHATGTTNLGLSRDDFLSFPVPEFNEVRQLIVELLESIENKIELNRQINQTLEEIAQTIFKSWFVDFEPVKAKIEAKVTGRDPERAAMCAIRGKLEPELDQLPPEQYQQLAATAALFPDKLVESELGMIPVGWKVSNIGDEVEVVGGGTPSTKNSEYWDDGKFHWTTPKDLSNVTDKILLQTERKITKVGLGKISSGLLPVNTVLMSSRAPVGYLALAKVPVAINQGYIAMKCNKRLPPNYALQWANSVMDEIKQRASGTTFAEISKKNFRTIQVIVPSLEVVGQYTHITEGIYLKITETIKETMALTETMDTLLPMLLSGKIELQG